MSFANNFYNLRKAQKLSQSEIANILNTSQSSVTSWETGARTPSPRMLQKISDTFNIPVGNLLSDRDTDAETVSNITNALHANPKLGLLFDKAKNMKQEDLDAVLAVVSAIVRENYDDDDQ